MLIHSGFSFAAACGAYFFSVSAVNHCTVTNTTVVQGGLIGYVFGQGIASNLNQTDCPTFYYGSILTMIARVEFQNVTFSISAPEMMKTFTNLYVFADSEIKFTDVFSTVFQVPSTHYIYISNSKYYIARMYFNIISAKTFITVIGDGLVEDIFVAEINTKYFATVVFNSHLTLRNVKMTNPNIYGGLVSASRMCTVTVSSISISGGRVESLAASFHSLVRMEGIVMENIRGDALVNAYLER